MKTSILNKLFGAAQSVPGHRPWPRSIVDTEMWKLAGHELQVGSVSLLALWAEPDVVHMAVGDSVVTDVMVLSLPCPDRHFPSIGQYHAPAIRLERAIQDLFGLVADGLPDTRRWLDHGSWGVCHPLGESSVISESAPAYPFLGVEGESLHQIPVGPVHAGIIEPGHFRFTASGEVIVRLEERLGYTHKGIESLLSGCDVAAGAMFAGRLSGDSTVAFAWAFARAVESAVDTRVPERALWLRALMAELERLANHLGDIGAVCNDAAFALMNAQCSTLRESVLRAAMQVFGHRLMMDQIIPGGTARDVQRSDIDLLTALTEDILTQLPTLVELYDKTSSLEDRTVGTGKLDLRLVEQFATGGFIGRASGRAFDSRRNLAYAPYDQLSFEIPVRAKGDVNSRIWIRFEEITQSLELIKQIIKKLPSGAVRNPVPDGPGEGLAIGEGFRGDTLVWVRLDDDGKISRCHLRDPSWFQWPLLEVAIKDNLVGDFPLCNKSFNCSYSGHDL